MNTSNAAPAKGDTHADQESFLWPVFRFALTAAVYIIGLVFTACVAVFHTVKS
jgi:hypothetical protein